MSGTVRQALRITLKDDCVFSARNASVGGHKSLDRIPGQALLGVVASKCYGQFLSKSPGSFETFHSGQLRFHDGLPLSGDQVAYPIPMSLHLPKRAAGSRLQANNRAIASYRDGDKSIRDGYITVDDSVEGGSKWVKPALNVRLKTAIDTTTGRAEESRLFGYESLTKGQSFVAWIEADQSVASVLDEVIEALVGEVWLGRSRSAEYGQVFIEACDPPLNLASGQSEDGKDRLWLISDTALPTILRRAGTDALAELVGLDNNKNGTQPVIDWQHTFIKTRRYSPWNAYRQGYDREREVLCAGSVITFNADNSVDPDTIAHGIGLYRECGLGRAWLNPRILSHETLILDSTAELKQCAAEITTAQKEAQDSDPLISWLKQQSVDWKTGVEQRAMHLLADYKQQISRAKKLIGASDSDARYASLGPSSSQWGRVLEAGRLHSGQALFNELFKGDGAIVKSSGEGWSEAVDFKQGKPVKLADWLLNAFCLTTQGNESLEPHQYAYMIRFFAHKAVRDMAVSGSTALNDANSDLHDASGSSAPVPSITVSAAGETNS